MHRPSVCAAILLAAALPVSACGSSRRARRRPNPVAAAPSRPAPAARPQGPLVAILPAAQRRGPIGWTPFVAVHGTPAGWLARVPAHGEPGVTVTLLRFDQRSAQLTLHAVNEDPGRRG